MDEFYQKQIKLELNYEQYKYCKENNMTVMYLQSRNR